MSTAGWFTFLGVVVTAILGLVSAWTSARANQHSAARAAELESIKLQIQSRDQQVDSWRADAEALRRERDEDARRCREQLAELHVRIEELSRRL